MVISFATTSRRRAYLAQSRVPRYTLLLERVRAAVYALRPGTVLLLYADRAGVAGSGGLNREEEEKGK